MAPAKNDKKPVKCRKKTAKTTSKKSGNRGPPRPAELLFDPDARAAHLRGFSERKRQRRLFGLAMQKVKDRKAKLAEKQEVKEAKESHLQDAEQQTNTFSLLAKDDINQFTDDQASISEISIEKIDKFDDLQTQSVWGGRVIVRTSTHIPGDDDDDDLNIEPKAVTKKKIDTEQQYAGNVERYLQVFKSKMPKKSVHKKNKGKHGASQMKGMAGASDMKIAQKALERSKQKGGRKDSTSSNQKGRGKKRK
jgi:ribosomal RNA-processing protein 17